MEDLETKKLGFDLEAVLKIESNDIDARSMRFVVGDRFTVTFKAHGTPTRMVISRLPRTRRRA